MLKTTLVLVYVFKNSQYLQQMVNSYYVRIKY